MSKNTSIFEEINNLKNWMKLTFIEIFSFKGLLEETDFVYDVVQIQLVHIVLVVCEEVKSCAPQPAPKSPKLTCCIHDHQQRRIPRNFVAIL